ncbi:unnamed protein product [Strongylus vulgaris]|uniref:Uncharacterized protein n=1 Tax=Strongylus vulgaris TaxID=40348 RepID=A0A3P7L2A9_STRVU|nr:unnamed protein product [Strongylus vulgaris]
MNRKTPSLELKLERYDMMSDNVVWNDHSILKLPQVGCLFNTESHQRRSIMGVMGADRPLAGHHTSPWTDSSCHDAMDVFRKKSLGLSDMNVIRSWIEIDLFKHKFILNDFHDSDELSSVICYQA